MTEPKERKKRKSGEAEAAHAPHRTDNLRVGDLLRQAREEQGLSLEEVCGSINIRTIQLRAIEDSNIDQLPGMTYATGFVRSYAHFLKLDSVAITKRFKEEHVGFSQNKPELHFPEPIAEDSIPNSLLIGIGALCAVGILVGWAFFSGGGSEVAEIPEAPAVTAAAEMPGPALLEGEQPASAPAAEGETSLLPLTAESGLPAAMTPETPATTTVAVAPVVEEKPPVAAAEIQTPAPAEEIASEKKPEELPVIEIKPAKTRVTLEATQSSWLQITDARDKVIFKKVMKPGEKYSVPDQPGLSLITSNAGGISVYVDGKKVNAIGGRGDIVRGISLNPKSLQSQRPRPKYN